MVEQEGGVALGHLAVVVALQGLRRLGKGGQHESIPRRQDLVVPGGRHPVAAGGQELAAGGGEAFPVVQAAHQLQDVPPLKVTPGGHAVGPHKVVRLVAQDGPDLVGGPDKVLALLALAVGVLGGVKAAVGIQHLAHYIIQDLFGDGAEERIAGHLPGVEVDAGELGVVVEHLLKVGCTIQYV